MLTLQRGNRSLWRLLALLLSLSLVAAACGSSDDEETSTDDAASDSASSSDDEADEADEADDAGDDAGDEDSSEAMEDAEPVELRFTWWGNPERDEKTIAMVDLFMEAHPNITVITEPLPFDGYFDKLNVGIAGGNAPDVMTLGGSYPTEYGSEGALLDLTQFPGSGIGNFSENTYAAAVVDGAVYGLPTGGNARGLLVNTALFEAAGVSLPDDENWTWDDYVALAGELTANSGGEFVGTDWRLAEMKEEFAAQRGSEMYLAEGGIGVSAETMAELFSIPVALMENGGMPSAEKTTELVGTTMEETLFGQGGAAMMFGYSNNVQNFADAVGQPVTMLKIPGESQYAGPGLTVLPSQFFGVYSGTEHPEEAAMLLNWLLSEPEPAKIILANRGLSFNPDVLEAISPELGVYEQDAASYLARVAEDGRGPLPVPEAGKGEVDDMTDRIHSEVLFGSLSPEEAGAKWLEEATDIIGG